MRTAITKIVSFDAAHRLPDHAGRCRNLHGHTYRLEATVAGAPQDLTRAVRYNRDVYPAWGRLTELVRTGSPVEAPERHLGADAGRIDQNSCGRDCGHAVSARQAPHVQQGQVDRPRVEAAGQDHG